MKFVSVLKRSVFRDLGFSLSDVGQVDERRDCFVSESWKVRESFDAVMDFQEVNYS